MDCIIIGIAGGTGSGKSTFTNRLKSEFGEDVAVVYHDNYYKHQTIPFEERKKVNYDHPDAFETELLVEHLKMLKQGQAVECPVYDYSIHNRSDETVRIEPKKIILLEGILVLADPRLRDMIDIKIFVEADADERILRANRPRCQRERQRSGQYCGAVSDDSKADALSVCGTDEGPGGYYYQLRT